MASSGSFLTNGWYRSSKGDYVYLEFAWSIISTSIPDNQSTIYWELRGKCTASGYVKAGAFQVLINEEPVLVGGQLNSRIELRNGTIVGSGTKTFNHNQDGTYSFYVYIEGAIYEGTVNCTGERIFVLDTIARPSKIGCSVANIGSYPTITIHKSLASLTHTIEYQFGNLYGVIAEKTSATSITSWKIPEDFYAQIPNAKIGSGTLTCTTYSGGSPIGDTTTCSLTVTTDETICKPTVYGTTYDINEKTIAVTGNCDILVRYRSTAHCEMEAYLNKEAGSILLKTINNIPITENTLDIPNVETGIFDFYVKDSREYFNSIKEERTLIPYIKLTNDATIYRNDPTSGKATLEIKGNYFDGNFGKEDNTLTVKYRLEGDEEYTFVTPTIEDNKYSAKVALTGRDYDKSFNYEVVVEDKIDTVPKPLTLLKGIPVFDWGENDFRFNVPVTINGVNILEKLAELEELVKG